MSSRPRFDFKVEWRPFQLNPDMPRDGMERHDYLALKFGSRERAKKIYRTIQKAADEEGLTLQFEAIAGQPNTLASHRLIRWSGTAGYQDLVVEDLFQRHFIIGDNIGDVEVLVDVARQAGMDADLVRELLTNGADEELVVQEEAVARRMGIAGVPCFVVDAKYAVSGAQDPTVLQNVFDLAVQDRANRLRPPQAAE